MLIKIALHSLASRRTTALITVFSIAICLFVLLGIGHIRQEAKHSFSQAVSGVDLIVGPRTGQLNLLLYSVFRLGGATNNIDWHSFQTLAKKPDVAWAIPLSLGDSHRGYPVLGTTDAYFQYFRYGNQQPLGFTEGGPFEQPFDVVIGAEVASQLDYRIGESLVLAHGMAATSFSLHRDSPFEVTGILKPTGTPVDRTLHIHLKDLDSIHRDWQSGTRVTSHQHTNSGQEQDLDPDSVTAILIGVNNRLSTFRLQREINRYPDEPLMAILPGVALSELWQLMSWVEKTLGFIALLVLFASLLGLATMLLSTLQQRQREIALLRILGLRPLTLLMLLELEALLLVAAGAVVAVGLLKGALTVAGPMLGERYGLFLSDQIITVTTLNALGLAFVTTFVIALIPAISAYRRGLHSGLENH